MMKLFRILTIVIAISCVQDVVAAPLIGMYAGAGCNGRSWLAGPEKWLGRKIDVALDGAAQDSWASFVSSSKWIASCWKGSGKTLVMSLPMLPADGRSTLAAGAAGAYDAYFREVASSLIANGHDKAVIRIGWEFNASWFRWNSLKEPEAWKAYWRRIVVAMRGVPGAHFQFDWCFIVHAGAPSPEPAYPGDDVVDVIGADVYNGNWNPLQSADQRWQALMKAPYGLEWHRRFAAAHGKPMSFPEWGTGSRPDGHGGGDDPVYMRNMAQWITTQPVQYHIYWDYKASDYDGRLSNGQSPLAGAEFLRVFGGVR